MSKSTPELTKYIAGLRSIGKTMHTIIYKSIKDEQEFLLEFTIRDRLMRTGVDGEGNLIGGGQYQQYTILNKLAKDQPYTHFTLFDEGNFHNRMLFVKTGKEVALVSRDKKTGLLIDAYGAAILSLNSDEEDFIVKEIIEPEITRMINKLPYYINL